jgi:glutamyl-tRNA synthetase
MLAFGWEPPALSSYAAACAIPIAPRSASAKNPVSLDYYRDAGFFPEALLNFLSLMGFAFGGDREKFTLTEMIEAFDWTKVSAGEPVFDLQKLTWLNGLYLHEMTPESPAYHACVQWRLSDEYLLQADSALEKERIERMDQFIPAASFFLTGDLDYTGIMALAHSQEAEIKTTDQPPRCPI